MLTQNDSDAFLDLNSTLFIDIRLSFLSLSDTCQIEVFALTFKRFLGEIDNTDTDKNNIFSNF